MSSTLSLWLARLEQAHPSAIELGLERVAKVRDAMGLHSAFPVILVGGTNGKGSTCAFLESILRGQGYKTGLYTSPHLLRYNERIRIEGMDADDAAIVAGLDAVEAARGAISLTYFEHGTLGAMWQFAQAGVDVAILEVGLGGRLDAVNIFDPVVSVITTIDLDHQDWLGDTREKVGFEKAGIYRAGKPAICGDANPPQSLLEQAHKIGAVLQRAGQDFTASSDQAGWDFNMDGLALSGLPFPALAGAHQIQNAATALAALMAVDICLPVSLAAIHQGLTSARQPGRFQRIAGNPETVLDVAHNPESARALADNLRAYPVKGETLAVFAMLADKDVAGVVEPLKGSFDAWLVAGLPGARGQTGHQLAGLLNPLVVMPVVVYATPLEAYRAARLQAGEGDRITVFGSFHTVAEVLPDATTSC